MNADDLRQPMGQQDTVRAMQVWTIKMQFFLDNVQDHQNLLAMPQLLLPSNMVSYQLVAILLCYLVGKLDTLGNQGQKNMDYPTCRVDRDTIQEMSFGMYDPKTYHLVFLKLGLQPPTCIAGSMIHSPRSLIYTPGPINEPSLGDTSSASHSKEPVLGAASGQNGNPPMALAARNSTTDAGTNASMFTSQTATIPLDKSGCND
ncbi:hypothetical protein FRC11_003046 [Ceratobasidium sp. 423]|nr:hypothetical protein FRC11_003046 [Ceratobasidium sp. 423]